MMRCPICGCTEFREVNLFTILAVLRDRWLIAQYVCKDCRSPYVQTAFKTKRDKNDRV